MRFSFQQHELFVLNNFRQSCWPEPAGHVTVHSTLRFDEDSQCIHVNFNGFFEDTISFGKIRINIQSFTVGWFQLTWFRLAWRTSIFRHRKTKKLIRKNAPNSAIDVVCENVAVQRLCSLYFKNHSCRIAQHTPYASCVCVWYNAREIPKLFHTIRNKCNK